MTSSPEQTLSPQWIRANGLEFGYLEMGEGPLVLCLHGFPDTAWSFAKVLPLLAAGGFRAVAPFMRGYAPTSLAPDGDYSVPALARDVIALIDHFGAERAHLVGHDWGAVASYAAAGLRPDRLDHIVTAAVPHLRRFLLRPTLAQLQRSHYMFKFQAPRWAEKKIPANNFAWLEDLIRSWSPGWAYTADDIAPLKASLSEPARLRAALAYYRALPGEIVDSEFWDIAMQPVKVPTRMIYGSDDGCIGPEMFSKQEHLFAERLDLCRMQGAGHFMQWEQPEAFAKLILEFLPRPTA